MPGSDVQGIAIVAAGGRMRQSRPRAQKTAATRGGGGGRPLRGSCCCDRSVPDRDGRRRESVAARGAAKRHGRMRDGELAGTNLRHCNLRRGTRIVCSGPFREIAMRCLPHVFLRGGLALLLLASVGVSAWAWPAHSCITAVHTAAATTATSAPAHC
jgi:hypothetical protein